MLTTENRGWTVEEVADRCLQRIIAVSDNAPPEIRDQAVAFKEAIRPLLIFYMKEVVCLSVMINSGWTMQHLNLTL